ncbi:transposase domain-containing protein [Streptomyces ferrugineus]|uniref:Transposase domain-containing protein n=1 Tax=Streptomyces ferrugineus TaxID=1413221 RepID=A0A7M2SCX5_9ACTN|nr:transposase domain-containing protein [Streptomyces ferrugineus]
MYSPGHAGELTQVIGHELVDAAPVKTGARGRRLRLPPARVVVHFVLAFAFFERSSYRAVRDKLTAGRGAVPVARPCAPRCHGPGTGWAAHHCAACWRSWPARSPTTVGSASSAGDGAWSRWTARPCPLAPRRR